MIRLFITFFLWTASQIYPVICQLPVPDTTAAFLQKSYPRAWQLTKTQRHINLEPNTFQLLTAGLSISENPQRHLLPCKETQSLLNVTVYSKCLVYNSSKDWHRNLNILIKEIFLKQRLLKVKLSRCLAILYFRYCGIPFKFTVSLNLSSLYVLSPIKYHQTCTHPYFCKKEKISLEGKPPNSYSQASI